MLSTETATDFTSILLPGDVGTGEVVTDEVLHDLALDQVLSRTIEAVPAAAEAFRAVCVDEEQIAYRQELFRAFEDVSVRAAWVLERVAQVNPEPFERLLRFAAATPVYRDETITRFAGEVWFYLAYLDYLDYLETAVSSIAPR